MMAGTVPVYTVISVISFFVLLTLHEKHKALWLHQFELIFAITLFQVLNIFFKKAFPSSGFAPSAGQQDAKQVWEPMVPVCPNHFLAMWQWPLPLQMEPVPH